MCFILSAAKNLFALLACVLLLAGCAAPVQKQALPSLPQKTLEEAIASLKSQRENIRPIRAAGHCLLRYRLNDKDHKENFPVKIWTSPPAEIYLQGDVAFDATGLVLGSNAAEFWFWLKPKEISSFWWGKWSQAGLWQGLVISPIVLLEAFGAVDVSAGDWSLTHGQYDILWLHNENGELLKRVFIEPDDYVVVKIEYFDSYEIIAAVAEFSGRKKTNDGSFIPSRIKINAPALDGSVNSAEISLSSVRTVQLNDQQRKRLFVRPKPEGFDHIFKIVNGRQVEQVNE
ncbi:MAG: hypothetical protein JW749_09950 [Sedimentisphaerales bacterium]|nr:hypothetical protein [Sedimentisphaerales bacterium]